MSEQATSTGTEPWTSPAILAKDKPSFMLIDEETFVSVGSTHELLGAVAHGFREYELDPATSGIGVMLWLWTSTHPRPHAELDDRGEEHTDIKSAPAGDPQTHLRARLEAERRYRRSVRALALPESSDERGGLTLQITSALAEALDRRCSELAIDPIEAIVESSCDCIE